MPDMNKRVFELSMGDSTEESVRRASIALAVIGFFLHVSIWALYSTGRISVEGGAAELLRSPLSALYTPILNPPSLRGLPAYQDYPRLIFIIGR